MKKLLSEKSSDTRGIIKWNKILLFLILLTVAFNILFLMRYNFQDNAAFYVTLAQEQLRTHSLLPEGMHYSSGLFIISPNLLIIPFLLLTDNLVLARQAAILLLWFFAYVLLYKIFVTKNEKNISGFVLAVSLFSILYVKSNVVAMHFYQGAYISYLLFMLAFLVLMNKIISDHCYNNQFYAGILILYVLANLGDIRNLIIWGIPGLFAYLIFTFLEKGKNAGFVIENSEEKKIVRVFLDSIMIGFIVFVFMAKMYGNYGSTASMTELAAGDYGESLKHIVVGLFNLFGNSDSVRVFSIAGIFKLVNFFVAILTSFVVPVVAIKKNTKHSISIV